MGEIMSRGGARIGAGRKKQEYSTVNYHRRVKPEWIKILDKNLEALKMNKEILDRGYVTHALTNEKGEIYGLDTTQYISWDINKVELAHTFYWSEIYRETGNISTIIRKGKLLINPTPEELKEKFEQSKINLN